MTFERPRNLGEPAHQPPDVALSLLKLLVRPFLSLVLCFIVSARKGVNPTIFAASSGRAAISSDNKLELETPTRAIFELAVHFYTKLTAVLFTYISVFKTILWPLDCPKRKRDHPMVGRNTEDYLDGATGTMKTTLMEAQRGQRERNAIATSLDMPSTLACGKEICPYVVPRGRSVLPTCRLDLLN